MGLLENDRFLNELGKMYERTKATGSVWVTMKRSSLKPRKSKKVPPPAAEYCCLIRANDGKRHISTTIGAAQHARFTQSVAVIMKAHMDALKRKEKNKAAKDAGAAGRTAA